MTNATARPRFQLRREDLFFLGMAALSVIVVGVGFARTYYLAGLFRAPLPNRLLHVHGAAFTLWILLFLVQISLVAVRRVSLHRRLGLLVCGLAAVMIVLGVLAASDRLARHVAHPGEDTLEEVRAFYAVPLADMLLFSTFVYLGYRNRAVPNLHKRFMLFATFSLLDAGFDRWTIFDPYPLPVVHLICFAPLVLLTMGHDWWSSGKVERVTLVSSVWLIAVQQSCYLIGRTAAWQGFAAWVAMHMPSFS